MHKQKRHRNRQRYGPIGRFCFLWEERPHRHKKQKPATPPPMALMAPRHFDVALRAMRGAFSGRLQVPTYRLWRQATAQAQWLAQQLGVKSPPPGRPLPREVYAVCTTNIAMLMREYRERGHGEVGELHATRRSAHSCTPRRLHA